MIAMSEYARLLGYPPGKRLEGAVLGRKFGLRHDEPRLHTHTRGIYGHFEDVAELDGLLGRSTLFRYRRDAGTMHHCFCRP